jgi:hypothetical protein
MSRQMARSWEVLTLAIEGSVSLLQRFHCQRMSS